MTALLASVKTVEETEVALRGGADFIDLKDPSRGALGRLDLDTIGSILALVDGRRPVSATIGDLPMEPKQLFTAVNEIARTGVDFVKIGLTPGTSTSAAIEALKPLAAQFRLIAVLFADLDSCLDFLPQLKAAGFAGIMLDTFTKSRGSLPEVLPHEEISRFVDAVKKDELQCGLAGSLKIRDIPPLLALKPDYLGFRSALCSGSDRTAEIDSLALNQVKQAMRRAAFQ